VIGLWQGEGGLLRRLLGEAVPFALGLVAGQMALPFVGPWGCLAVTLLGWLLASAVLVRVRRRPVLRRLYRGLLLLHVLFWSGRGYLKTHALEPPAAPVVEGVAAWPGAVSFRAGVGEATFRLPERTTLGGWGQRPRRRSVPAFGGLGVPGRLSLEMMGPPAEGEAPRVPLFVRPQGPGDALGARALLLVPDAAGPAFALVRLDLIVVDPGLPRDVLAAVGKELGLEPATLLLCATHTHSGPGGAQRAPLASIAGTDHFDREVYDAVLAACVEALRDAERALAPSHLAFVASRDRGPDGAPLLAHNRCLEDDEIDDRVLGLRVDDAATGRATALVLHYAVQPVILRRRHMAFGRDLPGALEDVLSETLPGRPVVLFVNGAMGDVSPRPVPAPESEAGRVLARRFAERVAADLAGGTSHARVRLRAAVASRDPGTAHTFLAVGSRAAFHDRVLPSFWGEDAPSVAADVLALPANVGVWSLGLSEVRLGFTFDGAAGAAVVLDDLVGERRLSAGVVRLEAEPGDDEDAGALIVWQGGVPTQGVGRAWRADVAARGMPLPFVLSLTNGALGYLTTAEEYDGRCRYEALSTLYGRESARLVEETILEALDALSPSR